MPRFKVEYSYVKRTIVSGIVRSCGSLEEVSERLKSDPENLHDYDFTGQTSSDFGEIKIYEAVEE
jgi:hypothetical protein